MKSLNIAAVVVIHASLSRGSGKHTATRCTLQAKEGTDKRRAEDGRDTLLEVSSLAHGSIVPLHSELGNHEGAAG